MSNYKKNSLTLVGAVSLGTGIMIGAAIFALVGQVAELSGKLFPVIFFLGALISGVSSYSYIKMSNAYPSAGGIAMFLKKLYGKTTITAVSALLMAFAMIINQSLVARTFGTYTMQLFNVQNLNLWIPALGVLLLILIFIINIAGNKAVQRTSFIMSFFKVGGIIIFAMGGLWVANLSFNSIIPENLSQEYTVVNYLGALAIAILAFAGFTSITNSGGEIVKPEKNVGRAIIISLVICTFIYLLVSLTVSNNLSVEEIIKAKDYSLAEAARPAFGRYGVWFTVAIAILATISGVLANVFAVSRMTAMLTEMKLIPHSHFGMPGSIQKHMLVYSVVIAITLTIFFDLTRIASIGAIFYLVMDIIVQWGVVRKLRAEFKKWAVITAIVLDIIVLGTFLWLKIKSDILVILVAGGSIIFIVLFERFFIKSVDNKNVSDN
ncbi:MAG: APC family permease [Bacteroidetes bacterium]|nr:APC family permease [Bacteroidota bacterium]